MTNPIISCKPNKERALQGSKDHKRTISWRGRRCDTVLECRSGRGVGRRFTLSVVIEHSIGALADEYDVVAQTATRADLSIRTAAAWRY